MEKENGMVTVGQLKEQINKVLDAIHQQKKSLEAKIEFSRKDAKEQLESVEKRLSKRIDSEVGSLKSELKQDIWLTQQALKATREELSGKIDLIHGRLDGHDRDIHFLKLAQAKP